MEREELGDANPRPSDEAIVEAIEDQRVMVRARLLEQRRHSEDAENDLMGEVALHLMKSLPKFQARGSVSLRAWANGVAQNVLAENWRQWARSAAKHVSLEEQIAEDIDRGLTADLVAVEESDEAEFFLAMLRTVRERIIARQGGTQEWRHLLRTAHQPARGRRAREQLREELAQVSGLPTAVFGIEEEGAVVQEEMPASVAPDFRGGVFVVVCTVHGQVGEGLPSIGEIMDKVREHQGTHRPGGTA